MVNTDSADDFKNKRFLKVCLAIDNFERFSLNRRQFIKPPTRLRDIHISRVKANVIIL